jgi:hypothetical protein
MKTTGWPSAEHLNAALKLEGFNLFTKCIKLPLSLSLSSLPFSISLLIKKKKVESEFREFLLSI